MIYIFGELKNNIYICSVNVRDIHEENKYKINLGRNEKSPYL